MKYYKKKAELLAPAGSYEGFLGAVQAGADAVYLGGNRFGARAYADNFTHEEMLSAIKYAHLFGRKVYLTVNTLFKQSELEELSDYLLPYYEAGLDAVIIQDMGAFELIGEHFTGLARHISTQMTVTGAYGARYLANKGAQRIVPARELSLTELKAIKQTVDVELETFVHGAMCYCYSGQCLFSSILGGRSGNRGRCAQPCRLPYQTERGKGAADSFYPLSLKDMCTITLLPELIDAGIDSFKIEGRMKSPEYAAGVTSIYRKYIDLYYEKGSAEYAVSQEDKSLLQALYLRSGTSNGYYHKHNGAEMITADSPGYSGREEAVSAMIRETYLDKTMQIAIEGDVVLRKGSPAYLTVSGRGHEVQVEGALVTEAKNRPLTKENVEKQCNKSGGSLFYFKRLEVTMEADVFLPVSALNQLRRDAFQALEASLIPKAHDQQFAVKGPEKNGRVPFYVKENKEMELHVSVLNREQLEAVLEEGVTRIYLPADLLMEEEASIRSLYQMHCADTKWYLALPHILRKRDESYLKKLTHSFSVLMPDGVLVRNMEELLWLRSISFQGELVSDANLYIWNKGSIEAYGSECSESYLPLELNFHELFPLSHTQEQKLSYVLYGRIPMMVSANCISKTEGECCGSGMHVRILTDRYQKQFVISQNCLHCYNVIFNTVPLSLYNELDKVNKLGLFAGRLDFTTESAADTGKILRCFQHAVSDLTGKRSPLPFKEYTKGHFMRGAE